MRKWIRDIREKTADMNREQAWEYIANYYWYHILIAFILTGLSVLLIYHIGWGGRRIQRLVGYKIETDPD